MKEVLIIFARNEIYGKVKTRLAATTSHDVAMATYRMLLEHTREVSRPLLYNKVIFYSSYLDHHDLWDPHSYQKRLQYGEDLGQRISNAFANIFDEGAKLIVLIGTDCPELTSGLIIEAFMTLRHYDVVLGPAKDGGYYLVGMKHLHIDIFQGIEWSTDQVLLQTLKVCEENKLSVFLLRELTDIDTEENLAHMNFTSVNIHHD